jgi:hypothetical protein
VLAAGALATMIAAPLHAQPNPIIFDGNILWNNGATGIEHFLGTAAAGSACIPGLDSTAAQVATNQFDDNSIVDPLLAALIGSVGAPVWQPAAGSPAYAGNPGHGKVVETPANGFFESACFVGAVGPRNDWTQGWTYYGLDGSGRAFPARPLVVLDNHHFLVDRTFSADSNYLVRGKVRVRDQATLTIPPDTYLFQETATGGTLIIERGGKIDAQGTAVNPIVITSDQPAGQQVPGGGGGLYINGYARINAANSCAGDSAVTEGVNSAYGGNDDADSSGVLRYVRVEFAGIIQSPNNEANSFTFNGVGNRTRVEYLQAHRGLDDLFEWFGGAANARYLVGTYGDDDGLDWQMGWRGNVQFAAIRQLAIQAGAERAIEADNNEFSNDTEVCSGRSNPTLANLTLVGDRRTGTGFAGVRAGVHLRRGTGGQVLNSIITEWKNAGFEINGAATFANHCADRASVANPAVACAAGTVTVPEAAGSVFVARSMPNPFQRDIAFRFSLPRAGHVHVQVFAADGRLVKTVADGEFDAGEHHVRWNVGNDVPTGVYFYRVVSDGGSTAGTIVRID